METLKFMDFNSTYRQLKEQDISTKKLNNKNYNINFLMKPSVFEYLMYITDSYTDTTKAYIPSKEYEHFYIGEDKQVHKIKYQSPNQENNYSDLSIIIDENRQIHFKACRVKSLSAISMNGTLISWNINAINDNTYLVFYSLNPSDMGKIVIMTTQLYSDFFVTNNDNLNIRYFNGYDIPILKEKIHINDKFLMMIDYSVPSPLNDFELQNVIEKYYYCYKSLKKHNENPHYFLKQRTHYGYQYTAYNFKTNEMVSFRDCVARNNFFESKGIDLANNHVINRNCNHMDKVVNGDELNRYQVNIFEKSGWIIMNYISNEEEVYSYVQVLLHKLVIFSKRWKARLCEYIRKIDDMIEKAIYKLQKFRNKIRSFFKCFRPITLYNYITKTDYVNLNIYWKENPIIKKRFKI